MASFNKVILMGNLTKDPEVRFTPSGTPVATFSLAVNRRYKQGEELKDEVCYIDIVVFGKQAENCGQYLSKGHGVIVDGRLQQRRWETDDGQKRSKHEVVAQTINFLPKRAEPSGTAASTPKAAPAAEGLHTEEFVDNDVPF
ncbi:MAG: single-stranded DNA-binding protein [Nitrospirae bacterium]|nr:single-stranded DNA-binding protein [Nitrospirota bacterium]